MYFYYESIRVVIANDVLEHFTEETSQLILKGLWEKAKKVLIIHVPTDSAPNKLYGHFTAFNGKRLREWAQKLNYNVLLSDLYTDNNIFLTDLGYLILSKNKS